MIFKNFIIRKRHLRSATRFFWGAVLGLIITLAIAVQLGRQAFPLLNDYREIISEKLGDALGVVISVDKVDAEWSGLKPEIKLYGVKIQTLGLQPIFDVDQASAELNIASSLFHRNLSWRRIIFSDFNSKIVQDKDGQWSIPGYELADTDDDKKFRIDDPFDLFLFGRRVEINNANLLLQFRNGRESLLSIPRVSLENDRYFHRLKADIDLDENDQAFSLVIEGYGDPRSDDDFNAKGYLDLENFPTEKVAAVFGFDGLNEITSEVAANINGLTDDEKNDGPENREWDQNQRLDLSVWFGGSIASGMRFEGSIDARVADGEKQSIPQLEKMKLPTGLESKFKGEWRNSADWFANIQDVSIHWVDDVFTVDRMSVYGEEGDKGKPEVSLRLDSVDLGTLSKQAIYTLNDAYPSVKKVIESLSLNGSIRSFAVTSKPKDEGFFLARGVLESGSVNAFLGSPEIKNVNGYFESSLTHGALKLLTDDVFSLYLPKLYDAPIVFETAEGVIDWRINLDAKAADINSSQLTVTNNDERAHGFLNLHLPFKREYGETLMNLVLGVEKTQAVYHKKYIPNRVSKPLRDWLGGAIRAGDLNEGAFLFRGSINKNPELPANIQVAGNITHAQLECDPAWPAVDDIDGYFRLDNKDLNIQIHKGSMLGAQIGSGKASLVRGGPDGLSLSVNVKGNATANQGKDIVINSSLPESLKNLFSGWQVSGNVGFDSKLTVSLKNKIQIGYDIDLDFDNFDLRLLDLNLPLEDLSGRVTISDENIAFSKEILGNVFNRPFAAQVFADQDQGFLGIDLATTVDLKDVNDWLKRPELQFLEGQTDLIGRIHIPIDSGSKSGTNISSESLFVPGQDSNHKQESMSDVTRSPRYLSHDKTQRHVIEKPGAGSVMLSLASSMSGVRINAPDSFAKEPEEVRKLSSIITLGEDSKTYRFVLGEQLAALVSTSNNDETAVGIAVNDTLSNPFLNYRPLFNDGYRRAQTINVFGSVGDAKFTDWLVIKDQYLDFELEELSDTATSQASSSLLTTELDLHVASLELGGMTFANLNVGGITDKEKWMFDLLSEEVEGKVFLYNNDRPIKIALERLKLPRNTVDDSSGSDMSISDSADVKAINTGLQLGIQTHLEADEFTQGEFTQGEFTPGEFDQGEGVSAQKKSLLSDANVESLPDMTITIEHLLWGDEAFGRWSFDFQTTDDGIKIDNLFANIKGINVMGVPDENATSTHPNNSTKAEAGGAQFFWDKGEFGQQSRFLGRLEGKNLGDILQRWDQEKLLDSEDVNALIDVDWVGAPDQFTLEQLQGRVVFDLDNGSFIRGAEVGENPLLRLFALLNFDTLARRLRLDFTDLAVKGFSFDEVDGDVSFDKGVLYLTNPITVVSSSSKMQLAGTVDLVNEEIDAELVATLPVASNLAFATAFVAGLPAAVGVYLIGKLFKEQVDKASSINYGITGAWSEPKLRVKEVFNDTAAKKKGKQTKEKLETKNVSKEALKN